MNHTAYSKKQPIKKEKIQKCNTETNGANHIIKVITKPQSKNSLQVT